MTSMHMYICVYVIAELLKKMWNLGKKSNLTEVYIPLNMKQVYEKYQQCIVSSIIYTYVSAHVCH